MEAFDEISRVYDATRDPVDSRTVERIVAALARHDMASLLEVGVGTGRMALPLSERGVAVTGLDASRGMLARARIKGLARLVRGSAYRLPFGDQTFDAALFVHVLHLLDDPRVALLEACRVARRGAVALVRPGRPGRGEALDPRLRPRRLVYESLARQGYPVPARASGPPHVRERRLLAEIPPDHLEVVREERVTEALARQLEICSVGASRWTLHVPPDVLRRAVEEARAAVGERTVTYFRVEALAFWSEPPTASAPPPSTAVNERNGAP